MMKKPSDLKITVLKRFDPGEVFKDPPVKAKYSGPCTIFNDGQVFHIAEEKMPEGFCPYAWGAIFPVVVTLKYNGNFSEWYDEPGVAVVCCNDGLRPVVFKIQRTELTG